MIVLLVTSLVMVVAAGSVGLLVTGGWADAVQVDTVLYCGAVNLLACWVAFMPAAVAQRRFPAYLLQAALAATVIRMLPAVVATLVALVRGWYPGMLLSLWMVVLYLCLLVVETAVVVRLAARRTDAADGHSSA